MDGSYIMSAASDITLKLWDSRRGACTSTLRQQQDYIRCLAYSRHREQVASGSLDHSIYLWDLKTLTSLTSTNNKVTTTSLRGQKDSVYSLAMNEAGTVLVAGGTDKVLQVWDPRTDEKMMRLKGHTDNVRALLLSPDGTTCVSGSSDGTVRLWSLGQQRCIETFRMHEEGVWALAADEVFQTVYSGGRDKKVYAIELNQGVDGSMLFVADAPVLCLTPDLCDPQESLWVATTESSISKWTFDPEACDDEEEEEEAGEEGEVRVGERGGEEREVEKEGEEGEEEESVEVTDIDEYAPSCLMKRTVLIPGGPSIREYRILEDRQHVLTRDSNGHVQLWDILHAVKAAGLGEVDLEEEVSRRKSPLYIPNWFSVEIKTGMLNIRLSESDCFSAWVMGANVKLDTATPDLKLNLGATAVESSV
ncbi:WD repeat-containing protein 48 [Geodia barretti]|nr:WD repeat-containing protein 48 [Geodia barretti]